MTECYCFSLRKAARKVSSIYDEALAPVGVNIGQFGMLRRIDRAGMVSLTVLGRLCALDRSTVGRNVRVLEQLGLVRSATGADQREAVLTLTDRGKQTLAEGASLWDAAQARIERTLGEPDAGRLLSLLQAL
ncbi:MarR family transcriptional regulator [Labrys miyagiensis]